MTTERDNPTTPSGTSPRQAHPSPDGLLAYHERELPSEAAERVQEHLVACQECARVVLDFASFPRIEPRDERHRLRPADVAEQWQDLERTLKRRRPVWQRHQVLLPLAAAFFAAAVGLGLWVTDLSRQLEIARGPTGTVFVASELRPESDRTRGGEETVEVPPWARQVVILLDAFSDTEYDRYGVDAFMAGRGRMLTGLPVWEGPDGGFGVALPRSTLREGEARIELFGIRDGRRVRITEYRFNLVLDET